MSQKLGNSEIRRGAESSLSLSLSRRAASQQRRVASCQKSQAGFGTAGILVVVVVIVAAIFGGFLLLRPSSDSSKISNLQSQVEKLEQTAKDGSLTSGDIDTLDKLQADIAKLQASLSEDTQDSLTDLTLRLETLESSAGTPGPKGAAGATGASGATGATGATGPSGIASCPNGDCLSLQASSPGVQETGNINVSGTVKAGLLSGSGASLTNVDASYLSGFNAGYFVNATNISTGSLADARLSSLVTLQGNTFNGVSQLVQLTAGGILPVLSGANLTSLNGSNISSGTVADARLSATVTLLGQTISNAELENSSLTITSSTGLSGGGAVSLGGVLTLTNTGVLSVTGTTNQITVSGATGNVTFSLPQDIAVTSSPTLANLTITTNLTTGTLTYGTSISSSCSGLTGYVWVPGSAKFGTLPGFCVMKYVASNDGSGNAVSVSGAVPYVSISQRTAQDKSIAAGGHLLTEAEWMTIATNALWVNANWCSLDGTNCNNAPGTASRYLASGHNDNAPAAALTASATDSEACYGTVTAGVNDACGTAGTQKRTLTLSNGSVIWDIGGNVWQWTDAWIIGNEQPNDAVDGFAWHEFTAITKWKDLNYANPTNRGWNSGQRLGQIYTDGTAANSTLYGFLRGGDWADTTDAGAFALYLSVAPTFTITFLGFRVAR